ncbi:MAG: ligase, partial [Actinotalea sp.]|nr:ligase [Actinotalea sp.]
MQPMLASRAPSGAELPRGPEWSYEVKWDGVRALADTTGDALRLQARSGRDITVTYPELAPLAELQGAVLDGEIVVMAGGIPSFEALAERMNVRDPSAARRLGARSPVTFIAFDIVMLYGVDLTRRTFDERRATLERLSLPERILLSPTYPDVDDLWAVTLEHGLEGVLAKRRTSTYQPGRRSSDWVKAAHRATRTAAVVGWRAEGAGPSGRGT